MENIKHEEITPSSEYIKGFNDGYVIAKHNPEFKTDSLANENLSDRSKGFQLGMLQYDVEKKLERSMAFMFMQKQNTPIDMDKDKSEIDMDKD